MTELDQRRVAKAFGTVLKSTRTNAGMSQEKLAELANIDRTYPSMLEHGRRQSTLGRVSAIANPLHIESGRNCCRDRYAAAARKRYEKFFAAWKVYALDCGASGQRGGRSLRPGTGTVNI